MAKNPKEDEKPISFRPSPKHTAPLCSLVCVHGLHDLYDCLRLHCGQQWGFVALQFTQINSRGHRDTHLGVKLVKCHDRSEEEEGKVEVVLEEVEDGENALLPLGALEREAHAAHDGEATSSIEKDILKIKSSCYKPALGEKWTVTTRHAASLRFSLILQKTSTLGAVGKAPNYAPAIIPTANEHCC